MDVNRSKYAPRLIFVTKCTKRAQLLESTGVPFIHADPPPRDWPGEPFPDWQTIQQDPREWGPRDKAIESFVSRIALRKAERLVRFGHWRIEQAAHTVVLAAKTILFDHDDNALAIPTDADEATAMVNELIRRGFRVATGCAYLQPDSRLSEQIADTAEIRCDPVGEDAVSTYIASDTWRAFPGGIDRFNLSGELPLRVKGDPTCVVGLPLDELAKTFDNWSLLKQQEIDR